MIPTVQEPWHVEPHIARALSAVRNMMGELGERRRRHTSHGVGPSQISGLPPQAAYNENSVKVS